MVIGLQPKPSDDEIIKELYRHQGRLHYTAKACGVNSMYIRKRIRESEEVQAAYRGAKDELIDIAENVMLQKLNQGSETAAKYILSTLGKDRGYTERTEVVGKGGGSIQVTLNLGRQQRSFDTEIDEPDDLNMMGDTDAEPDLLASDEDNDLHVIDE